VATSAFGGEPAHASAGGLGGGLAHAVDTDHLAFVLGAGLVSAMIGRPVFAPIAFVAAAAAGALAHRMGLQLVAVDPACAIMAAFAGVLLLIRGP
jgi:urease accessory protein